MPGKKNILVPIDFLPESQLALEYAVTVAKEIDAILNLVHILEEESPVLKLVIKDEQRDMMKRGASDKLDELAGRLVSPSGLLFTTRVMQGKIYDMIIHSAADVKADIIFMGRTDSSDMKKNITGTNTMHIIKEANIPVITLRKKPAIPGCSHILLPLDLTKQTIQKASNAIITAKLLKARITIVSFLSDNRKSIEIKFVQRLDRIRNIFRKLDVECDFKLVQGRSDKFCQQLNKMANELEASLVMIMTQQEMNFTEFFIGSHAQDVINNCDYPVLSINPLSCEEHGIPDSLSDIFINPIQILDY